MKVIERKYTEREITGILKRYSVYIFGVEVFYKEFFDDKDSDRCIIEVAWQIGNIKKDGKLYNLLKF